MNTITFPYHGVYTAKRSGYNWHYWLNENGSISEIERYYYNHYNGADHSKYAKGKITKELLDDIEAKLGKKTDGWRWISDNEIAEDEKLLMEFPLDGSYRKMKKSNYIYHTWRGNKYAHRVVYTHIPTNKLYYSDGGKWFGIFPIYCYNTKTGERGELYMRG